MKWICTAVAKENSLITAKEYAIVVILKAISEKKVTSV